MTVKKCNICGVEKDITEFYLSHGKPDSRCKECSKTLSREKYAFTKERHSATMRVWNVKHKQRKAEIARAWSAKNADKIAIKIAKRKKEGNQKSTARLSAYYTHGPASQYKCVRCNSRAEEWHHWSYSEEYWTSVIPVCCKCHKAHHAGYLEPLLNAKEAMQR